MADPAPETPVAAQKRPLEEPSSPSGPTEQPDAKRPALDKVVQESDATTSDSVVQDAATAKYDLPAQVDSIPTNEVSTDAAPTVDVTAGPVGTDTQGDTAVPDAPTNGTVVAAAPVVNGHAAGQADGQAQPPQYHPHDEASWLHVRAIISSAEAATVIGKGGENVTQIRRMAGAKCTVSEYTRGAVERILTVSGKKDAVAMAFGLITRTLNQEPIDQRSTEHSKTYPLRLLVPHILIGSIIGKQGARIREIQEESGARLNASESCLPLSTERSIVILGVADSVHIAVYHICDTLEKQLTERFGGPAASNYAGRHGGPHGVVPGGLQVVPYVPMHVGGIMGGPDAFRKHNNQAQRGPTNPYGVGYLHGQAPQPQAPAAVHYGAASPHAPYIGAVPPQPQAQAYGQVAAQPAAHAAHGQMPHPHQPAMQGIPGQPITQQIFIPNDMVGAIIGKGGAKINEIRQLSGSVIKINEPTDNNNERLVTVTGTSECNQMALYMLYARLGESSKNSNTVMPR